MRRFVFLFMLMTIGQDAWATDPLTGGPAWERSLALRQLMLGPVSSGAPLDQSSSVQGRHLSKVGILFSAAIPGTGQIYARSWVKGVVFLAAEVALWIGSSNWNDEGDQIKKTFHDYANIHWSEERWESLYNSGTDPSTHHLPQDDQGNTIKTQQYYEMIGKYDQFMQGWDDWVSGGPDLTPNRDAYETLRDDSNRAYIKASYCTMAILANHVISAMDVALTIHKVNAKAQMGVAMTPVIREPVLMSGFALNW